MSFREKSAWICLITTLAIFVPYFVYVFRLVAQPDFAAGGIAGALVAALVLQTVLIVAAHVAIAVRARGCRPDERDVAIEARSVQGAYYVLAVLVYGGVLPLMMWGSAYSVAFVSQLLLLSFIAAETTKYLGQVIRYRASA
jgi:uncharacterized membrane protein (DUF485 family)